MTANPDFPCSLVLDIPFPTPRLAAVALKALSVDKELSPSVRRSFSLPDVPVPATPTDDQPAPAILRVAYEATTNRMLRVSVNAFLDSVSLVADVMEGLDEDILEAEAAQARNDEEAHPIPASVPPAVIT